MVINMGSQSGGRTAARLEELVKSLGEPPYRAKQLMYWLYRRLAYSFDEMTDLPQDLRERLAREIPLHSLTAQHEVTGSDGTVKTLFALADGTTIESTLMSYPGTRDKRRHTVCVSTQVGCPIGCPFCATGQQGFERNLTPEEIIDQVLYFARRLRDQYYEVKGIERGEAPLEISPGEGSLNNLITMSSSGKGIKRGKAPLEKPLPSPLVNGGGIKDEGSTNNLTNFNPSSTGIKRGEAPLEKPLPSPLVKGRGTKGEGSITNLLTNIVFMGMGEPLANYDALWQAVETLNSPQAFGLGARNMVISTAGLVPGIKRLTREKLQVGLAVSLHAGDNALRDRLVPLNRKYPLEQLIPVCLDYCEKTGRRLSFEYVLFDGVNDAVAQARALAGLLRGINCHVNLIVANHTADRAFRPSPEHNVLTFENELKRLKVACTLRQPRGLDIHAGCGQLRSRYLPRDRSRRA